MFVFVMIFHTCCGGGFKSMGTYLLKKTDSSVGGGGCGGLLLMRMGDGVRCASLFLPGPTCT